MKEITILSGKGGTGKTSITAALASLARNAVFCDNDVDAPDLHLILNPRIEHEHTFDGGRKAFIDVCSCTECLLCMSYCRYDAIRENCNGRPEVNPFRCEGCRLCERICPAGAIRSEKSSCNAWFISDTRFGTLIHAKMAAGEENSGKLVTEIRKHAREVAGRSGSEWIINDGPPGVGCATIASLSGTDLAVLVIEPSKTAHHDAIRLVELLRSFRIPVKAILNKCDMDSMMAERLERYFECEEIPLLAAVPFDREMVEAMLAGQTIIEYRPRSKISHQLEHAWEQLYL